MFTKVDPSKLLTPARVTQRMHDMQAKREAISGWMRGLGIAADPWSTIHDGVVLCQLVQALGGTIHRAPTRHEAPLRNIDNLVAFIKALPSLGVPEHQIPVLEDLLHFRSDFDRHSKVVECLHTLSLLHRISKAQHDLDHELLLHHHRLGNVDDNENENENDDHDVNDGNDEHPPSDPGDLSSLSSISPIRPSALSDRSFSHHDHPEKPASPLAQLLAFLLVILWVYIFFSH